MKDALDRGLLAVNHNNDPRVNWYGAIFGRSYDELYDGPSAQVVKRLGKTFGVHDLEAGSISGPGKAADDLGVADVKAVPSLKPKSRLRSRTETDPFRANGGQVSSSEGPSDLNLKQVPLPRPKPKHRPQLPGTKSQGSLDNRMNPFDLKKPDLKKQADLLERSPTVAKKLILAAERDPNLFML